MVDAANDPSNPRGINLTGVADKNLLRWDATSGEFVRVTPAAAVTVPPVAASAPTKAEYDALRACVLDLVTKLQGHTLLA